MVAAAQQQQQQTSKASAEEEALKRNTDCVYFLASPLTCKKGSECEYRHSEYARVNPRDCYFWLNGNCLNPKCGYRHPPLDGLLGSQATASTATSLPSLHVAAPPATHAPQNLTKQPVPCIFFQKGLCLKGDRCAFLHGPNMTTTKAPQVTAAAQSNEQAPFKKAFGGPKSTQEQQVRPVNVPKEALISAESNKVVPKVQTSFSRNNLSSEREPPRLPEEDFVRYKATNVSAPVLSGNSLSRSNRLNQGHALDDQGFQNGKDGDEFLRESSPGFDVLVDDELGESEYYHGEDQYGGSRDREGMNEYDMGRSVDYNSMADIERETFREPRSYDSYGRRASSERYPDRRSYSILENPDQVADSDLRYRLSKRNRRVNGLRSIVNPDYAPENHREDRSHQGRDSHNHTSLGSSRLRGRIKLPSRSPVNGSDMLRPEREMDRGGNRGILPSGRLRDRIKGRIEDGGNLRGPPRGGRERMDFAGPKSLAELKGGRREQQILGKRKSFLEDHHQQQQSLDDVSFEGPMPLSEILKRKRGGGASEKKEKESKEDGSNNNNNNNNAALVAASERQSSLPIVSGDITNNQNKEEENSKDKIEDQDHEEGMIGDDHEAEGEYNDEYEQGEEGEDYNYEEGENGEEYLDEEEDGDDFAKKMGVMFS